ncbi:class I SAM-dependent DNA methyltransferase [Olivibacter sitiensis]|uniref:class I SAM-dependent DNA methyltransferase n=1 Tax=Olivibacter sitiensis TaxID=376470 RepID=UPI000429CB7A|nr:SAM-dependent methyltransferase [Olivibacter sitiensis]
MSKRTDKLYFDALYDKGYDPWNFEGSPYEKAKYRRTMEAIPDRRYSSALEIGCSIGVFTQLLAPRCERLLAVDISEKPLAQAKERLHEQDHVDFMLAAVPQTFPDGTFDLIVMSEVAYYLSASELYETLQKIIGSLTAQGIFAATHWRPAIEDCSMTGDEVHEVMLGHEEWQAIYHYQEDSYRIDVFKKRVL